MTLVIDQIDGLGKTELTQRCGELKARMSRTHDKNRSLRHGDSPAAGAQQ
jgi:hypothetical protein